MEVPLNRVSPVLCFRFGPFEARLKDEVLLREGKPVAIQRLPFQMLLLLLERSGELVTREELRGRLWTETTNVEFDNGLHVAAAKLREALGESVANPVYFKTVSRKGYQFIGDAVPVLGAPVERIAGSPVSELTAPSGRRLPRVNLSPALGGLLFAVILAGAWFLYRRANSPAVLSGETVLLGSFANATGLPELDGVFTSAFHRAMSESPYLRFLRQTNSQGSGSADSAATGGPEGELASCRQQQAHILLTATLSRQGQSFRVRVLEWQCSKGKLLTQTTAVASAEKDILSAIDTATNEIRRAMGEPEDTLKRFNVPMEQATTSSIAALRAFTLGDLKRSQGKTDEAFQDYKLATDLDPEFALAYARLGAITNNNEDFSLGRQFNATAFKLRNRATDSERLYLAAGYYASVTGNIDQAVETYQVWRGLYPYDGIPDNNLATLYMKLGEPQKAVDFARQTVQLQPNSKIAFATLAQAYQRAGDSKDLNPICRGSMREQNDIPIFHGACLLSAFDQNDQAGMDFELNTPHGVIADVSMLEHAAWLQVYSGHIQQASSLFLKAKNAARNTGSAGLYAQILNEIALVEAETGLLQQARGDAEDAIRADSGDVLTRAYSALVLARAGDTPRAEVLAREAATQAPSNTIIVSGILPCVQSSIRLAKGDAAGAVTALEPVRRLDFSSVLWLAPAYLRGLAYEKNHQPQDAALEFQRVVDHRAIDPLSPYVFLSRLELGHVLTAMRSSDRADREFSELRSIWASADPNFEPRQLLKSYSRVPIVDHR